MNGTSKKGEVERGEVREENEELAEVEEREYSGEGAEKERENFNWHFLGINTKASHRHFSQ